VELIHPGDFTPSAGFHHSVHGTRAHPIVEAFFALDNISMAARYQHRFPAVSKEVLHRLLAWRPRHFFWAGCDFFPVHTETNARMLLLETNSCPAGQKWMPGLVYEPRWGGYQRLTEMLFSTSERQGTLAVLYDKNPQEVRAYAATLAELSARDVLLVPIPSDALDEILRIRSSGLQVRGPEGWVAVTAALRYVTDQPWRSLPLHSATVILNPLSACLSGGRNKHLARIAYERFNECWSESGLAIRFPKTQSGLSTEQAAAAIASAGHRGIIKTPYGHAGEGVFPIVSADGLSRWRAAVDEGQRWVVQELIAEEHLSVHAKEGDSARVYDLRLMVAAGNEGFRPIAAFARRARANLVFPLEQETLRDQLITNLSYRDDRGDWGTDVSRVVPLDETHFDSLRLTLDDLVEACVQSVMSVVAIDQLASSLPDETHQFDIAAFHKLNDDPQYEQAMQRVTAFEKTFRT